MAATASREDTKQWVRELGADAIFDHSKDLSGQFSESGWSDLSFVFSTNTTHSYVNSIAECLAPQGRFALIDDPELFDIKIFKRKSISIHWELMFTRSLFSTADLERQGWILDQVTVFIDKKVIKTTIGSHYGLINASNLRKAHSDIESGRVKGKIVLEGF